MNVFVEEWFINEKNEEKASLIFLHDSFGCVDLWKKFPKSLGEKLKLHVLAYDRLGYGKSDQYQNKSRPNNYMCTEADFLIELMDQKKINKAILFGHSDGATIALLAGAIFPERIVGIISEAAHVFVEEITQKGIKAAVEAYKTTNLKHKLEKYHGDKVDTLFNLWAGTWLSEKFRNWNMIHHLKNIACPVFIIQGEKDEYGSLKQVEQIEKHVSGKAEKLIIPDVGHTPHKEAQKQTFEESIAFIKTLLTA